MVLDSSFKQDRYSGTEGNAGGGIEKCIQRSVFCCPDCRPDPCGDPASGSIIVGELKVTVSWPVCLYLGYLSYHPVEARKRLIQLVPDHSLEFCEGYLFTGAHLL